MLPAAAPTACRAMITTLEMVSVCATSNWNWLNIMLETVLEPAMKAPSAPTVALSIGKASPTKPAAKLAVVTGILAKSAPLTPELMKIRTIGMVNTSTKPAPIKVLVDSPNALTIGAKLRA
ncbi:Uncharacterised protein [Vibrio cholerae]|nr:Uncharacterised protein [Vibrio cholerae]CSB49249.1 Uncharacterised protein [Vibrio cholerae]